MTKLHVVSVQIAGEEYTIRTQASPEYTRDCAAHVDRTINEIMSAGANIQAHKAGILAALAVTDQLFETRREVADLRAQIERFATQLASEVEGHLGATDLAARS